MGLVGETEDKDRAVKRDRETNLEVSENLKLSSDSGKLQALRYCEKFENLENGTAISVAVCARTAALVLTHTGYVHTYTCGGEIERNNVRWLDISFVRTDFSAVAQLPGVRLRRVGGFVTLSSLSPPFHFSLFSDITIFRALPL